MAQQNWYLLTGAHSCGKTTAFSRITEHFEDLMTLHRRAGLTTYPDVFLLSEIARFILTHSPAIDRTSSEFQVGLAQVQTAIEEQVYKNTLAEDFVAIADRTLLDIYAYAMVRKTEPPLSIAALQQWMQRYDHIFVFSPKNVAHITEDVARSSSDPSRESLHTEIVSLVESCQRPYTVLDGHVARRHQVVLQIVSKDIERTFFGPHTRDGRSKVGTPVTIAPVGMLGGGENHPGPEPMPDVSTLLGTDSEHSDGAAADRVVGT